LGAGYFRPDHWTKFMPFLTTNFNPGILLPEQFVLVNRVFQHISSEPWFTDTGEDRERFAAYVIHIYGRGLVDPEKLASFCTAVAHHRFAKPGYFSQGGTSETEPER
jgi:hypothetical protein